MASKTSKAAAKARGVAVFAAVAMLLSLVIARLATYFASHGGLSASTIGGASGGLVADVAARPFAIDLANPEVLMASAATVCIMVALALVTSMKGERLENEDTGSEHGDDRLATLKEARSFADRKHYCNNVLLSENCHMAMKPHDKHTKEVLDGRNLNCITLGISGLGKTYNLVWPDLMQSVGDALKPMPCGWRNVPAHVMAAPAFKAVAAKMDGAKEGDAARRRERRQERGEAEQAERATGGLTTTEKVENTARQKGEKTTRRQEQKPKSEADGKADTEQDEKGERTQGKHTEREEGEKAQRVQFGKAARRQGASGPARRAGQVGALVSQRRRRAAEKRAKAAEAVTGGYDVFCTDPKGDNVRDVGSLYERAGYKVKVVDTIDFKNGLHVNPLAYIKSHAVDGREVGETRVKVRVGAPVEPGGHAVEMRLGSEADDYEIAPGQKFSCNASGEPAIGNVSPGAMWYASASYDMRTREWGQGDLPELDMGKEEIDQRMEELSYALELAAREKDHAEVMRLTDERDALIEKMNIWWLRDELGAGERLGEAGTGCEKVDEALSTYSYRRSSGTVEIEFKSYYHDTIAAEVAIELDDALVVDSVVDITCGDIEWPVNGEGEPVASGTVVWRLSGVKPKHVASRTRRSMDRAPQECVEVCEKLVLHVHVRTEFVADGVDLTKVVDCLVTNLKGTDAKSNGSEDPFWEDTKRLCFMSLVALLFERYGPESRTLPEVMRLLDMALSDSGNPEDPSPLQCLMEMWEYGRVYSSDAAGAVGRFSAPSSSWKKADNISHSRNTSLALHCYHAFMNGAPETVQSVIISCQACLVNLVTSDVKDFLSYDELELDTLGDPGQKQVIFCVTKDTNSPFDFLTALIVYLAIDLAQDKAYKVYGGKLPRHVRFVLDEAANIGKIPILIRALAVVRSRNISISMYLQSKAQLALVYGEKEADVIFDNCSTIVYLGAQTEETREEMSKRVGTETVQSRRFQRSFNQSTIIAGSTSESISSNERRVVSASKMGRLEKGYLMLFIFNAPGAIFDHKYKTREHPYYAYINPNDKRGLKEPLPLVSERFDYRQYLVRHGLRPGEGVREMP